LFAANCLNLIVAQQRKLERKLVSSGSLL